MRHKDIYPTTRRLNLGAAFIAFARIKQYYGGEYPDVMEAGKLGQRLIREIQHLHSVLADVRKMMPNNYDQYADPARVDAALQRTKLSEWSVQ